jgi:hypothetical protein
MFGTLVDEFHLLNLLVTLGDIGLVDTNSVYPERLAFVSPKQGLECTFEISCNMEDIAVKEN